MLIIFEFWAWVICSVFLVWRRDGECTFFFLYSILCKTFLHLDRFPCWVLWMRCCRKVRLRRLWIDNFYREVPLFTRRNSWFDRKASNLTRFTRSLIQRWSVCVLFGGRSFWKYDILVCRFWSSSFSREFSMNSTAFVCFVLDVLSFVSWINSFNVSSLEYVQDNSPHSCGVLNIVYIRKCLNGWS